MSDNTHIIKYVLIVIIDADIRSKKCNICLHFLHVFQTRKSPADLVNKLFPHDSLHH